MLRDMATYPRRDNRLLTVAQYEALEEPDEERWELLHGRLIREPAPGYRHGMMNVELLRLLDAHVRARGLGVVLVDTGFHYAGERPTVRRPDVAFVAAARVPTPVRVSFLDQPADLVIEIRSPSERRNRLEKKLEADLGAGVREVWVVDPGKRTVTVYTPGAASRTLAGAEILASPAIVPGFSTAVSEIFRVLD